MEALIHRGRNTAILAVVALGLAVLINAVWALTHTTTDSLHIQLLRAAFVAAFSFALLRGHQWARIILGVFGLIGWILTILALVLMDGENFPREWQQIYMMCAWISLAPLMFIPHLGVRVYQQSVRENKRSEQDGAGQPPARQDLKSEGS